MPSTSSPTRDLLPLVGRYLKEEPYSAPPIVMSPHNFLDIILSLDGRYRIEWRESWTGRDETGGPDRSESGKIVFLPDGSLMLGKRRYWHVLAYQYSLLVPPQGRATLCNALLRRQLDTTRYPTCERLKSPSEIHPKLPPPYDSYLRKSAYQGRIVRIVSQKTRTIRPRPHDDSYQERTYRIVLNIGAKHGAWVGLELGPRDLELVATIDKVDATTSQAVITQSYVTEETRRPRVGQLLRL